MEIPKDSYPRHTSYLYLPDDQVNLLKEYAGYVTEKDNCKKNSIENPKVSVIIPVYNVEKYLHKCLDSILRQTLKEIEIICIDDGSQDNSLEVIKEYASKDNRIIVISQENKKQGAARNKGIEIAKGEYLAFIDSDDCVELDYFEKLYSLVKSYDADIVTTNILKHKKKYNKYNVLYKKEASATSLNDKINLCKDKSQRFFNVVNKLYKKSLINDNNIRFAENCYFEDVMFSTKAIFCANKVVTKVTENIADKSLKILGAATAAITAASIAMNKKAQKNETLSSLDVDKANIRPEQVSTCLKINNEIKNIKDFNGESKLTLKSVYILLEDEKSFLQWIKKAKPIYEKFNFHFGKAEAFFEKYQNGEISDERIEKVLEDIKDISENNPDYIK